MKSRVALLLVAAIAPACMNMNDGGHGGHGGLPGLGPMIRPGPSGDLPVLAPARDENPDPNIVEVILTAAPTPLDYLPGKPTTVWAFNGTIPGPTIEAKKGDQVIVHFRNDLPEATTIHWHGVRVPNDMDGAGRLLRPIPPGGTFDYQFIVPDDGLFWYHPHVRSDLQVEKGLYGTVLVRDPGEPALGVATERLLVLDDVRVDPVTGQAADGVDTRAQMMGREGNLLLVNGQPSNRALSVTRGERVRLRLVNVANSRFFKLRLDGAALVQIGGDGGLLGAPRPLESLLLVPGERADVVVTAAGMAILKAAPYARASGIGAGEEMDLERLVPKDAPEVMAPAMPQGLRSIEVLAATAGARRIVFNERMAHHGWQFTINDRVFPDVPVLDAALGTRPLWTVRNDSDMDHPFHLHGFFFQKRGVPAWKDTINVPGKSTVDLVVDFAQRPGAAGDWMYHCHILEHAEGGMMGEARVR